MNKLPTSRHENASQITTEHFVHPHPLKTAVLFLVFNRPDTTKQVFKAIRQAKPPRLYVAADGPRADKPGEAEKVEQARRIAMQVDWDCEVKTLFREKNLGCGKAVSSAIDWFFENEEEGIILEDDCLPSQSFFWFCEELLERYRLDMQSWPHIRDNDYLQDIMSDKTAAKYWSKIFKTTYRNEIDSWAYRWTFSCWVQNGLTVLPNVNLVSNIGFDGDATHTIGKDNANSQRPVFNLLLPLKHPNWMIGDKRADDYTQKTHFNQPNIFYRVIRRLYRLIS